MGHANNGKTYTEEFKAQVLADWLLSGMSERAIAKKHGVSRASLVRWGLESTRAVDPQKQVSIDEIQEQIQRRLYKFIEDVADAASDQAYLRSQPAADLAVLVGVAADKAERLTVLRVRLAERAEQRAALPSPQVIDVPRVSNPGQDS